MHADMTVGLDLSSLENLKIFNGYEKVKKERKNSLELNVSSQEEDSDNGQGIAQDKKSRCGRPANPLPRHKRDAHIRAEYKRRDKIQQGFDNLIKLVPELRESSSTRESKSVMLFKTAEYCRRLKAESGDIQNEMWALREELEALGTDIHQLQEQLPQHGVEGVDKEKKMQMDDFYDDFVQERIKNNWRFWLFGFFMRPLYQSYRVTTSKPQSAAEFTTTVNTWIQETLSLTSLRKSFLEGLRKISTRTKIMNSPEKLEEEAMGNIGAHCIIPKLEAMAAVSPNPRPSTPKQPSLTSTPIYTPLSSPAPTPPRTPTSARRSSSRREMRKSHTSRSRSTSPQNPESKPKRRQSYRSEKSAQLAHTASEPSEQKPPSYSPVSSPSSPYSQTSSTASPESKLVLISPSSEPLNQTSSSKLLELLTTIASASSQSKLVSSSPAIPSTIGQAVSAPFIFVPFNFNNIPPVVNNSCSTAMTSPSNFPNMPVPPSQATSTFLAAMSNFNTASSAPQASMSTSSLQASAEMKTSIHEQIIPSPPATQPQMEVDGSTTCATSSFVPIVHSSIISNGTIQSQCEPNRQPQVTIGQEDIPDFFTMDVAADSNDSLFGTMSMFSPTSVSQPFATKCESPMTTSAENQQLHSVMNDNDDDSLMKMLTLDVMDVSSVMDFFIDQKDQRTNSTQKDGL